jgi:signal peptidase II
LFLIGVSIVCLAADLGTKWWAKAALDDPKVYGGRKIDVIGEHIAFIFAKNRGGAWGLLQDESEAVRRPFFLLISAAAILFIFTLYRRVTPQQRALKWGLPLVLGGALGNLVDRIRYSQVIDFIDVVYWRKRNGAELHWPTFNVADIAICVGVLLMAIDFLFPHRRPAPRRLSAKTASAPPPQTSPTEAPPTEAPPAQPNVDAKPTA